MKKTTFKPVQNGKDFVFESVLDSPMNQVYLSSSKSKYTFDRGKRFVVRTESESTQGYGFNGKGTGTTELMESRTIEPSRMQAFGQAAEQYFAAMEAYNEKTAAARKVAPAEAKK